ncbi:MAG TPA: M20/M25/M40 family metallo-hydrolase [Steroidobacteraceae bacterium]|jgi:acetylornithine deacetylase/succinyl-diaminopimelate desuccinylase-like protein|nr:M20/M25/M40 family metallo-hydrolase [Steroidobacteraceae bacterium]
MPLRTRRLRLLGLLALLLNGAAPGAQRAGDAGDSAADTLARDIFKQLIEINTTDSAGNVTTAAEALAERFRAAGLAARDVVIAGPAARKKNLLVRLHGTGKRRPLLLLGHLDVVEARREDWSTDPFQLIEKDGYFYGRGTLDMKSGDAIMSTTLLRMQQEGYRGSRDIILALTADEEGGCCNGVEWLVRNHRELIDAEFVLNHDGLVGYSITSEHGIPQEFDLSATEKTYADYQLAVTNRGGHSSLPRPDNAIYELAEGLLRVGRYSFPFELNEITRAYFERMATVRSGQLAADMRAITRTPVDAAAITRLSRDPELNSLTHTTCVATRLEGGHANNALPQRAQAVVNCRILPGHSKEEVRQQLLHVLGDPAISVRYVADDGKVSDSAPEQRSLPPSPLLPDMLKPLESTVQAMWHGLPVVPYMNAGATDGIYTRAAGLPTYGVAGIAVDRDDVRAHGRDERVRVASFYRGNQFFYRYLKALTAP